MGDDETAALVARLHEAVRSAQAKGDHELARTRLRAIQALDPEDALSEALLDGSARHCQMTLLFCDLVGSTPLAERLGPERMSELLRIYRTVCATVVQRYEGFIEDRQGDGLMVRFGPPRVHEDDPHRAILTGLGIVSSIRERQAAIESEFDTSMQVRISIHTGMVLIDAGAIVGTTPNEVARLEKCARPDEVLISGATRALVQGHFDLESRGPVSLTGVSRPIETYRVVAERTNAPQTTATNVTPFTGRQEQLEQIAELWRVARAGGSPPALLVKGGSGVGKSRLLAEAAGTYGVHCHCSGYHTATSLYAFRPLLARLYDVAEDDDPSERLRKLRAAGAGDLPLLAAALSIPLELTRPAEVAPAKLRTMALETAARKVLGGLERPAMLLVEDLQWADDSTRELLSALLATDHPGLLMLFSARDEFTSRWPADQVQQVKLAPLRGEELEAMVDALPAVAPLSAHQRAALLQRSDGVPLYVEELARSADAIAWDRERPSSLLPPGADIPPALRDSLMARLSSPGVDLEVAQIAATIGRDVDRRLLQEVRQVSDDEFQTKLANLLAVGILDRVDERRVRFRHELIRAAAYDTQLQSLRRLRHRRIAEVLPRVAVGSGDAGLVAFHLEHAGAHEEAIDAYIAAAQAGQALGAYREAMLQLTRALDLLERTDADQARELYVRQLRGFSAIMAGGYSSPLCREDHARCVELCEALGLAPALLPSLLANWSYYSATDIAKADRVTDAAERLVISSGLDIPIGAMGRGVTAFFAGRFAQARDLLEAFLAHPWSQPPDGPPAGWQLPNDPHVAAGAHLAAALAVSGESERAHEIARRALDRAAGLPFPHGPFSAAYVHSQLAMILRLQGDLAAAAEYGRRMFAAGEKHGFALFVVAGQIQEALSRVHDGEHDLIDPLTLAVRSWQELMAAEIWSPYLLTELAAAQALVGRGAQARASLERALECADHTGSHFFSSPTLRIRGELRLADGDRGGTDDLQAALELAREQGSPVFAALAETAFAVAAF